MTLSEAKRSVRIWRPVGWAVLAFVIAGVILIACKSIYVVSPNHFFMSLPVGRNLYNAISALLEGVSLISLIWPLIPTGGTQYFYFVLMSAVIGINIGAVLLKYAYNLNRRIKKVKKDVEDAQWKRSLGHSPSGNIEVYAIQLPSEDRWYQKPVGIIILGIAVEVIGGLLLLSF